MVMIHIVSPLVVCNTVQVLLQNQAETTPDCHVGAVHFGLLAGDSKLVQFLTLTAVEHMWLMNVQAT